MRATCTRILRIAVLLTALSLVACASGTTTGQTGGGAPTATPQPTATSAPITPPQVTQAFCLSIMTVADANQIMNPPAPATTLNVQADPELGACSWVNSQSPFPIVKVLIDGKPYTGPVPVPQATITQLATQLASEPNVTVTTTAPVSGIGDQAEFLAAHVSENGLTLYADALYIIDGQVVSECIDFNLNTEPNDTTQQSELQQCGQRVVAQL